MSHLEKSEVVILDLIEHAAIGCDAIFPLVVMRTLATSMPGIFTCYSNHHCRPNSFFQL